MSVTLYDDALLRKFKFWIKDPNLTILGVNESTDLFKYRLDQNNDKPLQLPIIALSRDPSITINSTTKQPITYDGLKIESKGGKTNQLNAIPIVIKYQLDIYTRYDYEGQEYVRNFVFNLINYPVVAIEVPYNDSKLIMNGYIHLDTTISDNSDVPERLIRDQFRRQTLSFTLDAKLYDYRAYDNWKICCGDSRVLLPEDELEMAEKSIEVKIEEEK